VRCDALGSVQNGNCSDRTILWFVRLRKLIYKKWRGFYVRKWKVIPQVKLGEDFNWKQTFLIRYFFCRLSNPFSYRCWDSTRGESTEVCTTKFRTKKHISIMKITNSEIIYANESNLEVINSDTLNEKFSRTLHQIDSIHIATYQDFRFLVVGTKQKVKYLTPTHFFLTCQEFLILPRPLKSRY
jgi:hypothetical protein